MIIFDASIRKYKKCLASLYAKTEKIVENGEDVQIDSKGELHTLNAQIDALIEGDYAKAVFDHYSEIKPVLIRIRTGEEVQWSEAFGDSFDKTTLAQRHALVGLIEGESKYKFK